MKFNWGTGILIFIIFFVVSVFSFVLFTTSYDINLVEDDYYPKELRYGERMEKISNSYHLEENIRIRPLKDQIEVAFPAFTHGGKPDGYIQVYRPSDSEMDHFYNIKSDSNGLQYLPRKKMLKGKYIIKIEWEYDGVEYYFEETLMN